MRKLLFILAIAGLFAACNCSEGQEANEQSATEVTEKHSDCAGEKTDQEARSDCDGKETANVKESKTDCCDSKTQTDCEEEAKSSDCDTDEKAENVAGNVPC